MKSHLTSQEAAANKQYRKAELLNDMQVACLTGSWEYEPETDKYFWSESMFLLHGLNPSSDGFISIEAAYQMIHTEDFSLAQNYWDNLHKTGFSEARFRILTADEKTKHVHALGKAVIGPDGQHFFRGSFHEERSEVHKYLLDEVSRQDIRIDILGRAEEIEQSGTWQINLSTYETFYSDNMFRLHGARPHSINSHPDTFIQFIHPDEKAVVMNTFEKSYHEKIPIHLEYRIIRRDEEERYLKVVSTVMKNEKGEQLLTGTTHDITERKWLELTLQQSHDRLKVQNQLL